MSATESDRDQRLGRLSARAGAGIEIRVLDSDGREIARGNDFLSIALPEGVYAVEWLSAGMRSESLVRVVASPIPSHVSYIPEGNEISEESGLAPLPRCEIVSRVGAGPRTSERNFGSSVAVVISAQDGISPAEVIGPTRLLDRMGHAMRANKVGELELELSSLEAARVYHVSPGLYRLSFRSITGEMLQHTVPAMRNRQTVVFLKAIRSDVLIAEGDGFAREVRTGINASSSVLVSVDGSEDDHRIRERIRLTGVLLHDLAHGTGSLSKNFVEILDAPDTDPLLRLYGALVVLSRLEEGKSPALDDSWPGEGELSAFRRRWEDYAARWIGTPATAGSPPDRVAAWWRLSSLTTPDFRWPAGEVKIPKRISIPPMTECAWRWAIAHSIEVRSAIPATPVMLAATRSPAGAAPWLCWKMSAAKAAPMLLPAFSSRQWAPVLASLKDKASALIEKDPRELFDQLSPEVGVTALRLAELTSESSEEIPASKIPTSLATSLALPAGSLIRRLVRSNGELSKALAGIESPLAGHTHTSSKLLREQSREAPGLSQRIQVDDDPHKGRFGGKKQLGGFISHASFRRTRSSEWTHVCIVVEGDALDGTPVHFYLHDSFIPDRRTSRFERGKAQIDITAWGAFTVGIWLPDQRIELELDLGLLDEAPEIFRTR